MLLGLIEYKLQKHGYTVYKAEDGQDALELLSAERFDVLLLDVMIPKLDGYLCDAGTAPQRAKPVRRL